jgi:DNA-binding CsgD family transcriptional regulator
VNATRGNRAVANLHQWIGSPDFESRALDAIRLHCSGEKAVMINHHRDGTPGEFLFAPFLTERDLATYKQHYAPLNPFAAPINALQVGLAVTTTSMVPLRRYRKLPYYSWAKEIYGVYEVGTVVSRAGADSIWIGFSHSLAKGDFSGDQVARLQSLIAPFRRAYLLHRRLRSLSALDGVRVGTLIDLTDPYYACFAIDSDRVIVDLNAAAEEHLANGSSVMRVDGRLRFTDPYAERILKGALATGTSSATIPLPNIGTSSRTATLLRVDDVDLPSSQAKGTRWLVFLPALQQTRTRERVLAFADEHSLTDTETRVLEQLVQGLDIPAIATRVGHCVETCRSVLKHIFQKSGTHRQSELVAKVLG